MKLKSTKKIIRLLYHWNRFEIVLSDNKYKTTIAYGSTADRDDRAAGEPKCHVQKGNMKIIHKPNLGIELAGKLVPWGTTRRDLQELWGSPSEAMNVVHNISNYLPNAEDIIERKDIYQNYLNKNISFAAVYDKDDIFAEFELHQADQITVADLDISFKLTVPDLVSELKKRGYDLTELEGSDENILINSLLTNFASSQQLGGDGHLVRYVYCSRSIDHLLEDKD